MENYKKGKRPTYRGYGTGRIPRIRPADKILEKTPPSMLMSKPFIPYGTKYPQNSRSKPISWDYTAGNPNRDYRNNYRENAVLFQHKTPPFSLEPFKPEPPVASEPEITDEVSEPLENSIPETGTPGSVESTHNPLTPTENLEARVQEKVEDMQNLEVEIELEDIEHTMECDFDPDWPGKTKDETEFGTDEIKRIP